MITTIILYIISFFFSGLVVLLPSWTVWPAAFTTGLNYFVGALSGFNFLFPIDTLFTVIIFIINFEVLYLTAKMVMKLFNYIRGTGSGLDI